MIRVCQASFRNKCQSFRVPQVLIDLIATRICSPTIIIMKTQLFVLSPLHIPIRLPLSKPVNWFLSEAKHWFLLEIVFWDYAGSGETTRDDSLIYIRPHRPQKCVVGNPQAHFTPIIRIYMPVGSRAICFGCPLECKHVRIKRLVQTEGEWPRKPLVPVSHFICFTLFEF